MYFNHKHFRTGSVCKCNLLDLLNFYLPVDLRHAQSLCMFKRGLTKIDLSRSRFLKASMDV